MGTNIKAETLVDQFRHILPSLFDLSYESEYVLAAKRFRAAIEVINERLKLFGENTLTETQAISLLREYGYFNNTYKSNSGFIFRSISSQPAEKEKKPWMTAPQIEILFLADKIENVVNRFLDSSSQNPDVILDLLDSTESIKKELTYLFRNEPERVRSVENHLFTLEHNLRACAKNKGLLVGYDYSVPGKPKHTFK